MSAQRLCLPGGALGPGCSPKPSRRTCMNEGRVQGPGAWADRSWVSPPCPPSSDRPASDPRKAPDCRQRLRWCVSLPLCSVEPLADSGDPDPSGRPALSLLTSHRAEVTHCLEIRMLVGRKKCIYRAAAVCWPWAGQGVLRRADKPSWSAGSTGTLSIL